MTLGLREELSRLTVPLIAGRRAEVAALLRFSGGVRLVGGRLVVEAELDCGNSARWLCQEVHALYRYPSEVRVRRETGSVTTLRYEVRFVDNGEDLARRAGLIDGRGRPVRGLPVHVVGGSVREAEAAWRGAILASGTISAPDAAAPRLEVACPGPESALALVGAARRLGIPARAREFHDAAGASGPVRPAVVIRDGAAIESMLNRIGAVASARVWHHHYSRAAVEHSQSRLVNFEDANSRRTAHAAAIAVSRVERAFELLADDIADGSAPEHRVIAGRLRVAHRDACLEELGRHAEPPLTKDTVAGRIRRLLALADDKAHTLGVPDTTAAVSGSGAAV